MTTSNGDRGRVVDHVEGLVLGANERGVHLQAEQDWRNFSKYGDRPIAPSRGARVRLGLDSAGFVRQPDVGPELGRQSPRVGGTLAPRPHAGLLKAHQDRLSLGVQVLGAVTVQHQRRPPQHHARRHGVLDPTPGRPAGDLERSPVERPYLQVEGPSAADAQEDPEPRLNNRLGQQQRQQVGVWPRLDAQHEREVRRPSWSAWQADDAVVQDLGVGHEPSAQPQRHHGQRPAQALAAGQQAAPPQRQAECQHADVLEPGRDPELRRGPRHVLEDHAEHADQHVADDDQHRLEGVRVAQLHRAHPEAQRHPVHLALRPGERK